MGGHLFNIYYIRFSFNSDFSSSNFLLIIFLKFQLRTIRFLMSIIYCPIFIIVTHAMKYLSPIPPRLEYFYMLAFHFIFVLYFTIAIHAYTLRLPLPYLHSPSLYIVNSLSCGTQMNSWPFI